MEEEDVDDNAEQMTSLSACLGSFDLITGFIFLPRIYLDKSEIYIYIYY